MQSNVRVPQAFLSKNGLGPHNCTEEIHPELLSDKQATSLNKHSGIVPLFHSL